MAGTLRGELTRARDRHWMSCLGFGALVVPGLAVSVASSGFVRPVLVGATLGCAFGAFVAGKVAAHHESLLASAPPARRADGGE